MVHVVNWGLLTKLVAGSFTAQDLLTSVPVSSDCEAGQHEPCEDLFASVASYEGIQKLVQSFEACATYPPGFDLKLASKEGVSHAKDSIPRGWAYTDLATLLRLLTNIQDDELWTLLQVLTHAHCGLVGCKGFVLLHVLLTCQTPVQKQQILYLYSSQIFQCFCGHDREVGVLVLSSLFELSTLEVEQGARALGMSTTSSSVLTMEMLQVLFFYLLMLQQSKQEISRASVAIQTHDDNVVRTKKLWCF